MTTTGFKLPAALIGLAALLWATDSIVRYPAATQLDQWSVTFFQNIAGLLVIGPWVLLRHRTALTRLSWKDWLLALVLGLGGSALGELFFTLSMKDLGPSSAILFQMAQPALVVALAALFLKERHSGFFFQIATWIILNAIVISFPNFNFGFDVADDATRGVLFALLAMLMWGSATVAGKSLLKRHSPEVVVFWRWLVAVISFGGVLIFRGKGLDTTVIQTPGGLFTVVYLGAFAGVGAMTVYYYGLRRIPASLGTFVELLYPLGGIFLPAFYFGNPLSPIQVLGGFTLIVALVLLIALDEKRRAQSARA